MLGRHNRRNFFIFMLALLSFLGRCSFASSTAGTLTVGATAINDCVFSSTTPTLTFASYDPTSATATTQSVGITANCTKSDALAVALNKGLNYGLGQSATLPAMKDASATPQYLSYGIYTTNAYSTLWNGCTTCPSFTSTSVATPISITFYGQIPAKEDVAASSTFADTVTITFTY